MTRPSATEKVPLARLMAMAFRSLIDRLHERLAARGFDDIRPAYGFVLLACRDRAIGVVDIAVMLGFTKQAASKLVETMARDGYVSRVVNKNDARGRRVQLTAKGQRALSAVEAIYAQLEGEWAHVLDARRVEGLRRDLTTVLKAQNGGTLPAVRPTF